jgi:hypothetical protein
VVRGGAGAAIWEGTGSTPFFGPKKVPTYGGGFLSHGGTPNHPNLDWFFIDFEIWDLWFWGIPILRTTQMGGESPMTI